MLFLTSRHASIFSFASFNFPRRIYAMPRFPIALATSCPSFSSLKMARLSSHAGNACGKREEWDKAIPAWEESLAIFKELNEGQLVASAMGNLGIAYMRLGKLKEAKENIEACLEVKKSINDVYDIARSIHNLGTIYWKMGNAEKAKELYDQALGMGEKSKAKSVHAMIYNDYVKLLRDTGDYKPAYEMLEKYQQL